MMLIHKITDFKTYGYIFCLKTHFSVVSANYIPHPPLLQAGQLLSLVVFFHSASLFQLVLHWEFLSLGLCLYILRYIFSQASLENGKHKT